MLYLRNDRQFPRECCTITVPWYWHTLIGISPDCFDLSVSDVVMPVVPMFHVNAWGLAYGAPIAGTKLVFPGPKMGDGATLPGID